MKPHGLVRHFLRRRQVPWPASDDRGTTAAEYALIASLIAVVIVLAVTLLGQSVRGLFDDAASSVSSVAG